MFFGVKIKKCKKLFVFQKVSLRSARILHWQKLELIRLDPDDGFVLRASGKKVMGAIQEWQSILFNTVCLNNKTNCIFSCFPYR